LVNAVDLAAVRYSTFQTRIVMFAPAHDAAAIGRETNGIDQILVAAKRGSNFFGRAPDDDMPVAAAAPARRRRDKPPVAKKTRSFIPPGGPETGAGSFVLMRQSVVLSVGDGQLLTVGRDGEEADPVFRFSNSPICFFVFDPNADHSFGAPTTIMRPPRVSQRGRIIRAKSFVGKVFFAIEVPKLDLPIVAGVAYSGPSVERVAAVIWCCLPSTPFPARSLIARDRVVVIAATTSLPNGTTARTSRTRSRWGRRATRPRRFPHQTSSTRRDYRARPTASVDPA
jgi:hypothetical protein